MAAKKFPLEIVIAATDKATAVMQRVSDRFDRFNAPMGRLTKAFGVLTQKSGLKGVGDALHRVGSEALAVGRRIATGMAVASVALAAFVTRQANAADAVNDTAERLKIGRSALQEFTYAFKFFGVEEAQVVAGLDTLNKNLGLAKVGMGKAVPLFRGLGIDPKRFKTTAELLPALANRLSKISDPAKRAAIANRLLGEAGSQMAVLLGKGESELRRWQEAAGKDGAIISDRTLDSVEAFNDTLDKIRLTLRGVAGNALGQLYPALTKIAEGMQAAIVRYQPQIQTFAAQFARNLPRYIDNTVDALRGLRDTLKPIADLIGFLVEKFGAANVVMGACAVLVGGKLIAAVVSLTTAMSGLAASMTAAFAVPLLIVAAVAAAVAAGWWLYKNWDKVSDAIGGTIEQIIINFTLAWERVKKAAVSAFEWIIDKLKGIWENSPLGMVFRGLGWVAGKLSSATGTAVASAPPVGERLMANREPAREVNVKVDLSNLPPGTRTSAAASGGMVLDLSRGYAMPAAW